MKNASRTPIEAFMLMLLGSSLFLLAGCVQNQDETKMKAIADGQLTLEKNLMTFDTLANSFIGLTVLPTSCSVGRGSYLTAAFSG